MSAIKVFLIDSSAAYRTYLKELFDSDPELELIGTALDPIFAQRKLQKQWPDVILLEVDLPQMDGITFLREIMSKRPTPVLILTRETELSISRSMEALRAGAVQIFTKPKSGLKKFLQEEDLLISSVKSAARANLRMLSTPHMQARRFNATPRVVSEKHTADVILPPMSTKAVTMATQRIIAIGASMGGTTALETILSRLPMLTPGIVVVQHMPEGFTKAFADRLNEVCKIEVHEAQDGDWVVPGVALLSPGNRHMLLKRIRGDYFIELNDGPPVCRHKPSVDVLYRSVAQSAGFNAVGVILTGMGDDGAQGMLELHNSGASTIAQNEDSCAVFGMPKEAIKRGAIDRIVHLNQVAAEIMAFAEEQKT
jgi:two-component system chemotaxis response regulator CheB